MEKSEKGKPKVYYMELKLAKFPVIVTIDSDLENNPEIIPALVAKLDVFDLVVASRRVLPRVAERWASKTVGKICGVSDFYSNFRAYKKEAIANVSLKGGETFGGELLIRAKKNGFRIGELTYDPPPRRNKPRIGGTFKANLRITAATWKCLFMYWLQD